MDYYYRPAGQHIEYSNGYIIFVDEFSGESCSQRIGKIVVTMEEKENEIGIRIITRCLICNGADQVILDDTDIIAKTEYNDSDGEANSQVIYDLAERYGVSAKVIKIEC